MGLARGRLRCLVRAAAGGDRVSGVAAGLFVTARQVGPAIGPAVLAAVAGAPAGARGGSLVSGCGS